MAGIVAHDMRGQNKDKIQPTMGNFYELDEHLLPYLKINWKYFIIHSIIYDSPLPIFRTYVWCAPIDILISFCVVLWRCVACGKRMVCCCMSMVVGKNVVTHFFIVFALMSVLTAHSSVDWLDMCKQGYSGVRTWSLSRSNIQLHFHILLHTPTSCIFVGISRM